MRFKPVAQLEWDEKFVGTVLWINVDYPDTGYKGDNPKLCIVESAYAKSFAVKDIVSKESINIRWDSSIGQAPASELDIARFRLEKRK